MVFSIEGEGKARRRLTSELLRPSVASYEPYDLIVEYDGEFWHRFDERRDIRKYSEVGRDFEVMRLRIQPLRRLRPADISVPSRADATTCARLALLHLAHRPRPFLISARLLEKIGSYLEFCATPLAESDIACGLCAELDHILQGDLESNPTSRATFPTPHSPLWDFVLRARELADRCQAIDGLWVPDPDQRGWEQHEAEVVSPPFKQRHQIALGHRKAREKQRND
ncbi:hypothetical protein [Nocardia sp. NPDC003183]